MADKGIPLSGRKESSPRQEVNKDNTNNNGIKQQTSRAPMISSRHKELIGSARDKEVIGSARDKEIIGSARDKDKTQQPQVSARDEPILTNRSVMDTARVHTALAALAAERNVLISKLNYIDSALESEKKKRNSRSIRK